MRIIVSVIISTKRDSVQSTGDRSQIVLLCSFTDAVHPFLPHPALTVKIHAHDGGPAIASRPSAITICQLASVRVVHALVFQSQSMADLMDGYRSNKMRVIPNETRK